MQNNTIEPIKVLVIDDSAFSRQSIREMLGKSPYIKVVGAAVDGYDGMEKIVRYKPDVVTLDIEMPKMDGITLQRLIMEQRPIPVIVVSAYGDSATVFKALEFGAIDFVVKPTQAAQNEMKDIEDNLLSKVLGFKLLNVDKHKKTISTLADEKITDKKETGYKSPYRGTGEIDVVAIGSSTGGPTALQTIITRFPDNFQSAVVISQHMPKGFTRQFAERINKISNVIVKEAEHGEHVRGGKVLICPGGYHMSLHSSGNDVMVQINNPSPADKYIPSIDVMMKSAAEIYGSKMMGVVLTGMGHDGTLGMKEIKKMGGYTIAESEETSVVFGMPQCVIQSGSADIVLPLGEIPGEILKKTRVTAKE